MAKTYSFISETLNMDDQLGIYLEVIKQIPDARHTRDGVIFKMEDESEMWKMWKRVSDKCAFKVKVFTPEDAD